MIALAQVAMMKTRPEGVRAVLEQSGCANCQAARQILVKPTPRIAGKRASILRKIWRQMLTTRTSEPT
jgi:hypothetical protein